MTEFENFIQGLLSDSKTLNKYYILQRKMKWASWHDDDDD